MAGLVSEIVYDGLFDRALANDKLLIIPLVQAEVPYAIKTSKKLIEQIDRNLRFLDNIEKLAEVKLGYQESLDKYL